MMLPVSLPNRLRRRLVMAPAAGAAAGGIAVAIVLASGGFSGARTASSAPTCLPRRPGASARLAGTPVSVSPQPGSEAATPATQISFLGVPAGELAAISVRGSRSGSHAGRLEAYSQLDGASFVPSKPFASGEHVSVSALIGPPGARRPVSFAFHVSTPIPSARVASFPNPAAPPSSYQSFVSAPTLHPPALAVTRADRDPAAGDLLMTSGPGAGQYGTLIFTSEGRLVWFGQMARGEVAEDLNVQRYHGQEDLTWWQGKVLSLGFGQGEDVVADHSYRTVTTVRAGNGEMADLHDFQIAPHGVAYVTVYDLMRCDLSAAGGRHAGALVDGAVQEIDMATGLVRWEWHSVDHVPVRESYAPPPANGTPWDWFHVNSVDPEPGGKLLVSSRSTWAVYQLDGSSGQVAWQLGGRSSSFAMGGGTRTAWQHDARLQPDGTLTVFDNGSIPRVHFQSRALRIRLDLRRHTASLLRTYEHPGSPLLADTQGNAQTLADGAVVIGWGSVPGLSEVSAAGSLLLDAHLPPGTASYRAFRFAWSGQPQTAPAVSARLLATEDSTAVFASWNGATGVRSWRVLAGRDPAAMSVRATMPDSGFESSLTYPGSYPYVAAQAIGAAGQVLASSPAVRVAPASESAHSG
jgi:Arylsulfotransferase (ASST)